MAVRRLGLAADRRRRAGGVPARDRIVIRSRQAAARDRGPIEAISITVPHRRGIRHRGNYRSARHASAVVRLDGDRVLAAWERSRTEAAEDAGIARQLFSRKNVPQVLVVVL